MTISEYHRRTYHHLDRFARSPGYFDWATMPKPFREYLGAPVIELPREARGAWPPVAFDDLCSPIGVPSQTVTISSIGSFLRYSLGLSAWKQAGPDRWPLRVNPSSGNLHPTEAYVIIRPMAGLGAGVGVHHYRPDHHALETRCRIDAGAADGAFARLPPGSFLVGLSSIHWREAWKYGERAYRYCQHDVGHAIAALSFSAALLGWDFAVSPAWPDEDIARLLGLDRPTPAHEREDPDCLGVVAPAPIDRTALGGVLADLVAACRGGEWLGAPAPLSADHRDWPAIEAARSAAAVVAPANAILGSDESAPPAPAWPRGIDARGVILGRRSAVDFDGAFVMPLDDFVRVLMRVLPRACAPWSALAWPPTVHLALFVHRVSGLAAGLYVLPRTTRAIASLRRAMRPEFEWKAVERVGDALPLFRLLEGDARALATRISCGQTIAGNGAFSLGMIAPFDEPLATFGPWFYRRLFWEAGTIGQVLYLEAEAAGARGTGIGCYFDSAMHDLLGFEGTAYQSLYHFTVGRPIEDHSLQTQPGYEWELR